MIPYSKVCQTFFHGGTHNIIFHIPRNPYVRKCSHGRNGLWRGNAIHLLINYCHEKLLYTAAIHKSAYIVIKKLKHFFVFQGIFETVRGISKFQKFYIYSYIFHDFSRNTVRYSAEPWLGNTAL